MSSAEPRAGSVRAKLTVNTFLAASFVALSLPAITRIPVHEWLSLAFCVVIAFHVAFSWTWVARAFERFSTSLTARARFNFAWDALLYLTLTLVMVSGLIVSEAALPALGVTPRHDAFWSAIHSLTSMALMVMVAIHLAMHWSWITTAVGRWVTRALPVAAPRPDAATWWMRPVVTIALAGVVVGGASITVGATPWANALRARAAARRERPAERLRAPLANRMSPPGAAPTAAGSTQDTPSAAVERSRERLRPTVGADPEQTGSVVQAPRRRPPLIPLRRRLMRGARALAVYMALPFLAALAVLSLMGRQRSARPRRVADPLDELAD